MDALTVLRSCASAAIDLSFSICTGLLLAEVWLTGALSTRERELCSPRSSTLTLYAGGILGSALLQLYLLSVAFSGETSFTQVIRATPGIVSTHAGSNASVMIVAALLLVTVLLVPMRRRLRIASATCLLLLCLCVHAGSGHAGTDGSFSRAEFLQAFHLTGMSVWSGGVIVSGLYVLPRLASGLTTGSSLSGAGSIPKTGNLLDGSRSYLMSLSTCSTWAVATVVLTGLIKGFVALGGDIHKISGDTWGYLLVAKIAVVLVALSLGGLNRRWIRKNQISGEMALSGLTRTLRFEAWAMLVVLLLSAILGNISPPGE